MKTWKNYLTIGLTYFSPIRGAIGKCLCVSLLGKDGHHAGNMLDRMSLMLNLWKHLNGLFNYMN